MPKSRIALVAVVTLLLATPSVLAGPLHDAVKDGDLAQLQELIEAGEDLSTQDKFVGTALHWAALKGEVEAAQLLVAAGADTNVQAGTVEITPLHLAAEKGNDEIVILLLEGGANVNALNLEGTTPLHLAAGRGR